MLLPPKSDAAVPLQWNGVYIDEDIDNSVKQDTRILIADDDAPSAHWLSDSLTREGCSCEMALCREHALEVVRNLDCDIVICDARMKGMSEFELLERIKTLHPQVPVIIGTAAGSIAEAVEAVKRGAHQYFAKPLNIGDLVDAVVEAIAAAHQYRKTTRPPRVVTGVFSGDLVHESAVMRALVDSIALVARSDAPVLILGESGTGKERVARAIHAGGPRASQPFVAVNSSAIPEALLESEVFGHVRGAFTGATQARRGLLLEANGGTLLLDEIGDMPIMLQPKLLRVLQFGETRPVGSDRFGHVDVRMIAATHRDLNLLVREGRFREDLRYRLNVIPLVVPPLRERREDVVPLVTQFLEEAHERTPESPVRSISDEAMSILLQAAWPGNVRELENTIERLVVLGREAMIVARDLGPLQEPSPGESWSAAGAVPWTLKQMNQRYLDWVLARTDGDKVRAAGILNVDLSTLYRWARAKR
jgi:two-component system, NtrC family, response regulator HydG